LRKASDVIIIGAGVIGAMTARELCAAGLSVTLVDRGPVGGESSHAGGGLLAPLYPWQSSVPVAALARWSVARYPRIVGALLELTGIDAEYECSGAVYLGDLAAPAAVWAEAQGLGVERLHGAQVRACEPALATDWTRAAYLPGIAQVRNPRLMRALHAAVRAEGVEVIEHAPIETIEVVSAGGERRTGRVAGVRIGGALHRAGHVVIAAGAWSGRVMQTRSDRAGAERPGEGGDDNGLGIRPMRGQMLWYQLPPGALRRVVLNDHGYLIPRRDGVVLAGSTVEDVGFDKSVTEEAIQTLSEQAGRMCPALRARAPSGAWAGLRPGSRDGIPTIGAWPDVDGLFVNSGHFRNGLNLAPASARLCADLLLGRRPALDPTPYAPAALAG
jgi:glycine oxidase